MAIGLVVLGALIVIYLSTHATSRQVAAVSRLNEDASIALHLIGAPLRIAGFSLPRIHVAPGTALVNGVDVAVPDRNFIGAGVRGCDHGFKDAAVRAFDDLACAPGPSGAAAFAIRFEGAGDDIASVRALLPPNEDCLTQSVDVPTNGAIGLPFRLIESRFLMKVNASINAPELFCSGKKNNFTAQALMQYVEHIAVRYGIAADGASRDVENYLKAEDVDALPGTSTSDQRWSRVVSVRICILMRSADPVLDGASAYVDCEGTTQASTDRLIRRAYSSVFTLRNRGGIADGS